MSEQPTKLGGLITDPALGRDAVHVAVAPVVAGQALKPGQHVRLDKHGRAVEDCGLAADRTIGIVDPFLEDDVEEGDMFWLCLYPGSTGGLRHAWTHPAFARKAVSP